MQEIIEQLSGHLRGIWRFRWYIHGIAWVVCIAGWSFVSQMPDQYEAKTKVFVDTSSALRPLLRGLATSVSADRGLDVMTRTLMSRTNLEKVARMTDMDLRVSSPEEMDLLIERLKSTIKFTSGRRGNNLYSISYTNSDPQLAKNIVQSLLTIFVESTLGDSRKGSDSARNFIDQQIKEYEQRLIDGENRLKEFKRKNANLMMGKGEDYFSQIKAARIALNNVELELKQATNLRDEFNRQIEGEVPVFGISPSSSFASGGASHPLDSRIALLEQKLDELLLKYTTKHPDVVNTQATKKRLEEKRDKDLKELNEASPKQQQSMALNQNPVFQQLKISLSQAEAKIAGLTPRVEEYRKNVKHLEKLVDTIPQIEADLKNLNRDYGINKKNYDALLSRRESAKMSEQASASADNLKFRIIDPPIVPFEPTGPNRPLFINVVFLGSLVLGIVFAFFLSQIKPTFDTPKRLQEVMNLPVLGYVSRVWTFQEKKRRRIDVISFGVVGLLLVIFFGGVLVIEMMNIDVVASIKSRI